MSTTTQYSVLSTQSYQPIRWLITGGSVFNLILSFILVPIFHHVGSAISVVMVEAFITLAMFVYLQTHGLKIIGENCLV